MLVGHVAVVGTHHVALVRFGNVDQKLNGGLDILAEFRGVDGFTVATECQQGEGGYGDRKFPGAEASVLLLLSLDPAQCLKHLLVISGFTTRLAHTGYPVSSIASAFHHAGNTHTAAKSVTETATTETVAER